MQFWFVTVVPKYLNFALFSKDLLAFIKYYFVSHPGGEAQPHNFVSVFIIVPTSLPISKRTSVFFLKVKLSLFLTDHHTIKT
jgi:hypothetical protein